jgi:TetR/AcrR family transcriptional regulator, mexJK operon transcriptional repressor
MERHSSHDDLFSEPLDPENAKRNAILLAAARLFLEEGFEPISMDSIAAAAEVSKRTVYSYFPSKAELFAAIMVAHCNSMGVIVLPDHAKSHDPRQVLTDYGRVFVRMITSRRAIALQRVIYREVERFPEVGKIFFQNGPQRQLTALAAFLRQAHKEGRLDVSDPEGAAYNFLSIVKAPFHLGQLCGLIGDVPETAIRKAVDSAVAVFLRAYASPARATSKQETRSLARKHRVRA